MLKVAKIVKGNVGKMIHGDLAESIVEHGHLEAEEIRTEAKVAARDKYATVTAIPQS